MVVNFILLLEWREGAFLGFETLFVEPRRKRAKFITEYGGKQNSLFTRCPEQTNVSQVGAFYNVCFVSSFDDGCWNETRERERRLGWAD